MAGYALDTPEQLKGSPAIRALYNELKRPVAVAVNKVAEPTAVYLLPGDATLNLALKIDATVRAVRPDGWRGIQARENQIKKALLPLLDNNEAEVERIFLTILQHGEY